MNELKTKTEKTTDGALKKNPWRRLPKGGKIAVIVVGILAVLAVLAALYVNGKLDLLRYDDGSVSEMGEIGADEDQDLDGTGLTHTESEMTMPEGSPFSDDNVLNILLIGTDERTEAVNDADAFTHLNQLDGTEDTTEFSDDARSDSMILVSLDIKDHVIRLVSIERGTGVPILLDGYEGQYDWITHTFRYGGAKLTMKTIEDCFNVQVDHYVRVNFNSFVQIVDAVGGVDLDITEMEAKALNWEVPSNSMLIVNHVDPGPNHFDGYTALQYARLRKIDNDWKRVERQRTVIKAVLDQVQNASVMELDNLLNTILPLIQTNFTKSEIAALLVQLPGFLGCDVQQMSMPLQGTYGIRTGMDDRLMYDPDWVVNIKALQDFLYNDKTAEEVIAATPETAAAEAAGELVIATRESADVTNPVEEYNSKYLHRIDMTYALDASDFGSDDYRVFVADTDNLRGNELRGALIDKLYSAGVRVVAVPDGAAAGVLGPLLLVLLDKLLLRRFSTIKDEECGSDKAREISEPQDSPIIIAGFGRYGQIVARVLLAQGIRPTILDHSVEMLEAAQIYGHRVFYGDATRMDLLRIAGAAKAHVLVIAVDTPEQSLKIASQVRKHFPNLEIVARTRDLNHWFQLRDLGVEHAQREVFESSLISAQSVLELLGQSPAEAKRITTRFREHNLALAERMYPHYKDKNQLIAVAKQGRQQLVEQMAKERADLLAGNAETPDTATAGEQDHSPADARQP